jgi:hypothetical protein
MDRIVLESPDQRRGADLGACPRCAGEGRGGRIRILEAVDRTAPDSYGFAGCDADAVSRTVCGYTAILQVRRPPTPAPCPECERPTRPVRRGDGGHSIVCDDHGWFLADPEWRAVPTPCCPVCGLAMVHRERSGTKGRFFWACFTHRMFADSDVFGSLAGDIRRLEDSTTGK